MKGRSWFVVPFALILAALPGLALACDLRCESVGGKASQVEADQADFAAVHECCPAMADRGEQNPPARHSSGGVPCHGKRSSEIAVLAVRPSLAGPDAAQQLIPLTAPGAAPVVANLFFSSAFPGLRSGFRLLPPAPLHPVLRI
jgi:hypothetical protein